MVRLLAGVSNFEQLVGPGSDVAVELAQLRRRPTSRGAGACGACRNNSLYAPACESDKNSGQYLDVRWKIRLKVIPGVSQSQVSGGLCRRAAAVRLIIMVGENPRPLVFRFGPDVPGAGGVHAEMPSEVISRLSEIKLNLIVARWPVCVAGLVPLQQSGGWRQLPVITFRVAVSAVCRQYLEESCSGILESGSSRIGDVLSPRDAIGAFWAGMVTRWQQAMAISDQPDKCDACWD